MRLSLICLLVLAAVKIEAQPINKMWDFRFGSSSVDYFIKSIPAPNDGILLTGYSRGPADYDKSDTSRGDVDYWIVRVDSTGQKLWDKTYGGNMFDVLGDANINQDGSILFGGYTISDSSGDVSYPAKGYVDFWVVKTDAFGNKLWDKRYGGSDGNILTSIIETYDGNYLFGGYSASPISGDKTDSCRGGYDYWILKTDISGNKLWDKTYGGYGSDELFAMAETQSHDIVLIGWSESGIGAEKSEPSRGMQDYWIVKTDEAGNLKWDKTFGGVATDEPNDVLLDPFGNIIVGGSSFSDQGGDKSQNTKGLSDFWLVKLDSSGQKIWDRDYGAISSEEFYSMSFAADQTYLLTGDSYSPAGFDKSENNLGYEQVWLIKVDTSGIIQWDKTVLTNGHDENGSTSMLSDGCFLVTNRTNGGTGGYVTEPNRDSTNLTEDYWMVKLCDTTIVLSVPILNHSENIFLYPDPSDDEVMLNMQSIPSGGYIIEIYDMEGRLSKQFRIQPGQSIFKISTSDLKTGLYSVRVSSAERQYIRKLMIQH